MRKQRISRAQETGELCHDLLIRPAGNAVEDTRGHEGILLGDSGFAQDERGIVGVDRIDRIRVNATANSSSLHRVLFAQA
jgi:hypothetical protein